MNPRTLSATYESPASRNCGVPAASCYNDHTMRIGGAFLIFLFCFSIADAFTVILKNGKNMEGTLLSEEPESIRFRDIYGVTYTLKKDLLNIPAMLDANPEKVKPMEPARPPQGIVETTIVYSRGPSLAEIARENLKHRTGTVPVLKNAGPPLLLLPSWPKTSPELVSWIAQNDRDFHRLASQCRAAGANPSAKHSYRQDTYIVEGKEVVVSGYWADPEEIQSARQICSEAMALEKALALAKKDLRDLLEKEAAVDSMDSR